MPIDIPDTSISIDAFRSKYRHNRSRSYLLAKRLMDLVIAGLGGLILLLPMLIVALLIRLETPGPAIYKQQRIGRDGKPFDIYKFRSMYTDAEKNGPQWALIDDVRCTRVGRFIRVWHIDELPQLLNVLRGDMTIVGPRPEREFFYREFERDIPDYRARLLVDQGLTCIAQVNGCYDLTPQQRFDYDVEYMQKQSILTDIKCILQTFTVLLNHRGAR